MNQQTKTDPKRKAGKKATQTLSAGQQNKEYVNQILKGYKVKTNSLFEHSEQPNRHSNKTTIGEPLLGHGGNPRGSARMNSTRNQGVYAPINATEGKIRNIAKRPGSALM